MKTYTGGCHCSKIKYEVDIENLKDVIDCNCSICSKRGWILTFVPAHAFRLIRGETDLTDYHFNKHLIHHLFCSTCGISSFTRGTGPDGSDMVAINVRCLDDVTLDSLSISHFDGKNQ